MFLRLSSTGCAAILLLAMLAGVQAEVSTTIILPQNKTVADGFRDIPIGSQTFRVTLQSGGAPFDFTGLYGSGYVTWYPEANLQGTSTHAYYTIDPVTQFEIGYVNGYASYEYDPMNPDMTYSDFYTSNALFFGKGVYAPPMSGPTYDEENWMSIPITDHISGLPASFPGTTMTGFSFSPWDVENFFPGDIWFTCASSSVAVYRWDDASGTWVKADTAFHYDDVYSATFKIHADENFSGFATVKIHYRSDDTGNPGIDGDSLDIIEVYKEDDANPPAVTGP